MPGLLTPTLTTLHLLTPVLGTCVPYELCDQFAEKSWCIRGCLYSS